MKVFQVTLTIKVVRDDAFGTSEADETDIECWLGNQLEDELDDVVVSNILASEE
jgi:hypothetical protein